MSNIEELKKIIEKNNGIICTKDIKKYNIHRQYLTELINARYIERISRGVYAKIGKNINDFFIIGEKYSFGIYSHSTALYLYNMTDRTPIKYDMTFPKRIRLVNDIINSHYTKDENYELGLTTMRLKDGTKIKIYDIERTICDIIRDRNKIDPQIFSNAIKEYGKYKNKNLYLLYKYAKAFKINNIVRKYMEVID